MRRRQPFHAVLFHFGERLEILRTIRLHRARVSSLGRRSRASASPRVLRSGDGLDSSHARRDHQGDDPRHRCRRWCDGWSRRLVPSSCQCHQSCCQRITVQTVSRHARRRSRRGWSHRLHVSLSKLSHFAMSVSSPLTTLCFVSVRTQARLAEIRSLAAAPLSDLV